MGRRRSNGPVAGMLSERGRAAVVRRLSDDRPVRRALPGEGRLHIDRQLPFLCVYRRPPGSADETTARLITTAAAYLRAPGDPRRHRSLVRLVQAIAALMVERFGAFLLLELWASDPPSAGSGEPPPRPQFDIYEPAADRLSATVQTLRDGLAAVNLAKQPALVTASTMAAVAPPGLRPLFSVKEARRAGVRVLGIGIRAIYLDPQTGAPYPMRVRSVKRQLGRALAQTFYEFAVEHTTHQPPHYHALGRHAMVKAVWDIDRRLAAISNSFDLLLHVTPINAAAAWADFKRARFAQAPLFLYRPRPIDPGRMKRTLYDIPVDRIEDPSLLHLFLEKQTELDRQLTMLQDIDRRPFLYGSLQLYGEVGPRLVRVAREMLTRIPPRTRANGRGGYLTPSCFARRVTREFDWYRRRWPDFHAAVEVRDDLYGGLLCTRGRLLIGRAARIPVDRAEALVQHEVGTHLVTYYNGLAQPFRMLAAGLPGYSELQEGLAVLAEYLVGELSPARLRVLAARVLAVHDMVEGASFAEVFRRLTRQQGFSQPAAFTICMRVFRGGGFTKDAIYLRGLLQLLEHLARQGSFEHLLVGKIAPSHLPVVDELLWRQILRPAPLRPRYLDRPAVRERLRRVQQGLHILDLLHR